VAQPFLVTNPSMPRAGRYVWDGLSDYSADRFTKSPGGGMSARAASVTYVSHAVVMTIV